MTSMVTFMQQYFSCGRNSPTHCLFYGMFCNDVLVEDLTQEKITDSHFWIFLGI